MTWFADSANQTEAAKSRYAMFLAVSMDFTSGFVRVWTGHGNITIGGNTYVGIGTLGRVSQTSEKSNLTVDRKTYQLAGAEVNPALVSETDIDASFGRAVIEYFGFLTESGQLLATPEVAFEGEISSIRRVDGADPMIEVNAENRLVLIEQNDGWRYTHEHQQEFYAGQNDLGFDQVKTLDTRERLWGGRRVVAGGLGHRGGGTRLGEEQQVQD